jgi:hypothetical protein
MDNLIDHIASGAAVLIALVSAFFNWRKKPNRLDTRARLVAESVAYGRAHQKPGIPLERTCLECAILLDMKDNGKRDFSDAELFVSIRAALAA